MKKLIIIFLLILPGCSGGDKTSSTESSAPGATVRNDGVIQLNWNVSSGAPDGYYVEQSFDGVNFDQIQSVAVNNAVVVDAIRGKTYHFRVRAYNSGGNSPYSDVVDVTP